MKYLIEFLFAALIVTVGAAYGIGSALIVVLVVLILLYMRE